MLDDSHLPRLVGTDIVPRKINAYLAKRTLAYSTMKIEVVKSDLTVKVDRLRKAAADTSHIALGGSRSELEGRLRESKYKEL